MGGPAAPGHPAGRRRRPHRTVGRAAALLPLQRHLPASRRRDHRGPRRPLRRPPRPHPLAHQQRVLHPRPRRRGCRPLPHLAAPAVRQPRRPQHRVGHRLLEPDLRRLGGGAAAPAHPLPEEPGAGAGLPALHLRHAPGVLHRRARHRPPAHPAPPGHHQLHAAVVGAGRLALGRGGGRRLRRPLPRPGRPVRRAARGARAGHDPLAGARPVDAHGAGGRRGQLASGEPPQAARPQPAVVAPGRRARRGRRLLLPVAAVPAGRREVPLRDARPRRSRWARPPGDTQARRGSGPHRPARGRRRGRRRRRRAARLARLVGERPGGPPSRRRATPRSSAPGTVPCGGPTSPRTSPTPSTT